MKETDPPGEVINGAGIVVGSMTVTEVTGLINLFNAQLLAMEGRLVAKMDDNSRLASERWSKHDRELEKQTLSMAIRFESVEKSILIIENSLQDHLDKEHDEELVIKARVKPVQTTLQYVVRHWRTAVVIFLAILGILGWSGIEAHILGT
jgi:hypothetical protein